MSASNSKMNEKASLPSATTALPQVQWSRGTQKRQTRKMEEGIS